MENTMLIVDDIEMNREILKLLFHEKYGMLEAESGTEAIEILERCQGNIDIVLLDLIMPDISGFEVLEMMKKNERLKNIPVVVITSSNNMNDHIKAFRCGANDYINKPFVPEIVIARIENVMASHSRMLTVELEAQKLKVKSELDEMTGLYNKTTTEQMSDKLLTAEGTHLDVLMVIDIDNFKSVNDTSGHQAGDHVIKIIADLISSLFRKTDVIGRVGGDEFVVLMNNVPSMDIARTKVNELIRIMRYKPNLTIPEYVTLSIGMAQNERCKSSYAELFAKADEALYDAKQGGKAQYREYGIAPVNLSNDDRPAILLISNNRNVCSIAHAVLPNKLRIIEALSLSDLDKLEKGDVDKIVLTYADVSDLEDTDEATQFWEKLKGYDWINMKNVYAICREGNTAQYMITITNGVADFLTAPLDTEAFKRRSINHLEAHKIALK